MSNVLEGPNREVFPEGDTFFMQQALLRTARHLTAYFGELIPEQASTIQVGQLAEEEQAHTFILSQPKGSEVARWMIIRARPSEGERSAVCFEVQPEQPLRVTYKQWDNQGRLRHEGPVRDEETAVTAYNLLADFLTGSPSFTQRLERARQARAAIAELIATHNNPKTRRAASYQDSQLEAARAKYKEELFTAYPAF